MRVALYARVSTEAQVEGYSIGEQLDRLEAYAKARDYNVLKSYVDGGHSGATLERPAMQELINNISKYEAVIVFNLKRLSRSQKDTLFMVEDVFLKNNVEFISLSESLDTSTPYGRAMIGILSAFAQLDREQITEQFTLGRVARAKAGYYHGGASSKAPTGYDYIDGELVINEYEAECVKYIFKRYTDGIGYLKIYDEIADKFPNVIADDSTIQKILRRPLYSGYVEFSGELYKGRHIPLIDKETFDSVQKTISKRASRNGHDGTVYMLTGLLYCGHCGARMAGFSGKRLASGETMKYYICYTRRGSPKRMMTQDKCDKKYERKERLEKYITDQVKKLTIDDIQTKKEESTKKETLENEITSIDKQISKLVELFTLDKIPYEMLNNKIDELNERKEKLLAHIKELKEDNSEKVIELIATLHDFDKWQQEKQQMAMLELIEKITVYNERIEIDWLL